MPSDDLLSPSMFACTLDETGVDGYRPAALRLLEAHDAAQREQIRTLREALEAVAAFAGKTLLGPDHDREATRIYSTGANRAFEETAAIARAAIDATKEKP